jgi:MFS family permease
MELDELKNSIRKIQRTSEYRMMIYIAISGIVCLLGGFLSGIIFNIMVQNEPGTWTLPIYSLIIIVIGIILVTIFSIMEPRMFPELRELKLKYKKKVIEKRRSNK